MAVVVGITGGIGSGKSTVCNVFRLLGAPVFEADVVARQLMNTDPALRNELIQLFGEEIYTPGGELNRTKLAGELFENDDIRIRVNELVHPAVRRAFYSWLEQHETAPYVIYEAAILFEGGFNEKMDYSLLITAPEEERVERVIKRQGISENSVRQRMQSQWPDERKKDLADFLLANDNRNMILPEIIRIDYKLKTNGTIW